MSELYGFRVQFVLACIRLPPHLIIRAAIPRQVSLQHYEVMRIAKHLLKPSHDDSSQAQFRLVQPLQDADVVPVILGPAPEPVKHFIARLPPYLFPGLETFPIRAPETGRDVVEAVKSYWPGFYCRPARFELFRGSSLYFDRDRLRFRFRVTVN